MSKSARYNQLRDPLSVHAFALDLQQAVPSEKMTVEGINFWILVRQMLFQFAIQQAGAMVEKIFGKPARAGRIYAPGVGMGQQLLNAPKVMSAGEGTLISTQGQSLADLKDGLLFVELPSDYTGVLGDTHMNTCADPVILLSQDQHRCVKLCRFQQQLLGKRKWVEPTYFTVSGSRIDRHSSELANVYDVVAGVNRHLKSCDIPYSFNAETLITNIRAVLGAYHAALGILDTLTPRVVFTQNFNGLEKLGFLAACKKRGIVSVDLMHGIEDRNNIYHDYPEVPPGQISPYPDLLWCWGEVTKRNLEEEQAKHPQLWRQVMVGGYPWKPLHKRWFKDARIELLKAIVPADKHVALYCHDLTPNAVPYDGYLPKVVLQAMRESADSVFWLLRTHPRSFHLIDDVAAFLAGTGVTNVETLLSSEMMIDDLFDVAGSVVTGYSVAGLEGATVGLKCITFDPVGAKTFAPYIESGHAHYCSTAEAIVSTILKAEAPREPLGYVNADPDVTRRALQDTLDFVAAGKG